MRLELWHPIFLFFVIVFLDGFILVISGGQSAFTIGRAETSLASVWPAFGYLSLCFVLALLGVKLTDRPVAPPRGLRWRLAGPVLMLASISVVLLAVGTQLFSIEASTRQVTFADNPLIPVSVLFALPIAVAAIVASKGTLKLATTVGLILFFSFTGSRIHIFTLGVAFLVSFSDRAVRVWHLVLLGALGFLVLELLGIIRSVDAGAAADGIALTETFASGHYSTFDIQTVLMDPSENIWLVPWYPFVAAAGPFRSLLGLQDILSASEFFTLNLDSARFFNERSLATVGLTGELYMLAGWYGALFVLVFVGLVGKVKSLLYRLSTASYEMDRIMRCIGFVWLFLLFRSDMWMFFVYLWIQLPVLLCLALIFTRKGTRVSGGRK